MEDAQIRSLKQVSVIKSLWVFALLFWQMLCFLHFVQEREIKRQVTNVKVIRSSDHNPDVYMYTTVETNWDIHMVF